MARPLTPNVLSEPVTVTIAKLIHGGRGMGRIGDLPIFVEGALEGERVEATITRTHTDYIEARVTRIIEASAHRVAAPCRLFGTCGGCQLQHLAPVAQSDAKRAILQETLRRLGGLDVEVPPIAPSPEPYGYRLRAGIQARAVGGRAVLGFYESKTHTVVPMTSCAVLHPRLQAAIEPLRASLDQPSLRAMGCAAVEMQTTSASDRLVIVFHLRRLDRRSLGTVGRALQAALPLAGVVAYDRRGHHRWVGGADALDERIAGALCRVSDRTFLQINAGVNAAMVSTVVEWASLRGHERVVDLYAGFGNFTLPLAARAAHATAVESTPSAAADARVNARRHGVPMTVVSAQVESWNPAPEDLAPDLLVVDPPRGGLTPRAIDRVIALAPARILYVSCEPSTLSRDIRRLGPAGYRLTRAAGFDLFPQTAHLETIAELVRS
ncbi:MAG: class I SAM-dependent RNA methyltransferase [Nitrospiria bacterium]